MPPMEPATGTPPADINPMCDYTLGCQAAYMGAPEVTMEHLEFGDAWVHGFRSRHPGLQYRRSRRRRTNNASKYNTQMLFTLFLMEVK